MEDSNKIYVAIRSDVCQNPRIKYIFNQIFKDWYGRDVEFLSDQIEKTIHINYGCPDADKGIKVYCLDKQEDINTIGEWRTLPIFYHTDDENLDVPFDIFRAIFHLISREEEYGSTNLDRHGRYDYKASLAYRYGFLDRPLIDEWLRQFESLFNSRFPDEPLIPKACSHLITIDVDNVFAYRNKGLIRHTLSFVSALFSKRSEKKRLNVLLGREVDPFFNIEEIAERISPSGIMFFHCGGYGKNDKKTIFPSIRYWKAKQRIEKKIEVGLHPSYRSARNKLLLRIEKWILEKCIGRKVTSTRMHYLLFFFPDTARTLIDIGITDDYSMAYSDVAGYRASTARSFKFYDLERETVENLTIHPLIVMDKTLRSNMRLTPDEAIEYLGGLKSQCERAGVPLTMLFHNENLTELNGWGEWRKVFESVV